MVFGCEETLSSGDLEHVHEDPILLFSTAEISPESFDSDSYNPNPRYAYEMQKCPQLCDHRDETFVWMLNVPSEMLFYIDMQS